MIPIPYGTRYSVTVSGQAEKTEVCEACKCEHVYVSAWWATASTLSFFELMSERAARKKSEEKARAILERTLSEPEMVACPLCGWFQTPMIAAMKRRQLSTGSKYVVVLVVIAWLVALYLSRDWTRAFAWGAGVGAVGLATLLGWQILNDPNSRASESQRKNRAVASKAKPIETYRAMQSGYAAHRGERDAQLATTGSAELSALSSVEERTATKRQKQAQQRRHRALRRWNVAAIIAPSIAALIGIGIDYALFSAPQGELPDRIVLSLAVPPFVGMFALLLSRATYAEFNAGGTKAGSKLPDPHAVVFIIVLVATAIAAVRCAVNWDRPTFHGYVAAGGSESALVTVMLLIRRLRRDSNSSR